MLPADINAILRPVLVVPPPEGLESLGPLLVPEVPEPHTLTASMMPINQMHMAVRFGADSDFDVAEVKKHLQGVG